MLAHIRAGETFVVSTLDCIGRNAHNVATTIKSLAARRIEVIVLQLDKPDHTSATGMVMLAMLAAVTEMESDLLVEHTQASLARVNTKGKTLDHPTKTTDSQRAEIIDLRMNEVSVSALSGYMVYRGPASCG